MRMVFRQSTTLAMLRAAAIALALLTLYGCAEETIPSYKRLDRDPNILIVYCACGLLPLVETARDNFLAANPEKSVEITADEPRTIAARVRDGDVPDIVFLPGDAEISELERDRFLDRSSRQMMGELRLVIAVPRGNPAKVYSLTDLQKEAVRTFSISTPGITSPGTEAKQELERAKLWVPLQNTLAVRETPLQVLENIANGTVEAALIFDPCLRLDIDNDIPAGSVELVGPVDRSPKRGISNCAVLHKRSPNQLLARRFLNALAEQTAREVTPPGVLEGNVDTIEE